MEEELRLAPVDPECTISCGLPGTRMRSHHVSRTEVLWKILLFTYLQGPFCPWDFLLHPVPRLAVIEP